MSVGILARPFPVTAPGLALALLALVSGPEPATLHAQEGAEEARVLEVAEAALEAISREDAVAFTDFMVEEAVTFSVTGMGEDPGYTFRSRADWRQRNLGGDVVERGFDPVVHVQGRIALVWLPYDIYVDGEWSHCGIDTFTLLHTDGAWRIAALAWTVEQPPACRRHPDGPPPGD